MQQSAGSRTALRGRVPQRSWRAATDLALHQLGTAQADAGFSRQHPPQLVWFVSPLERRRRGRDGDCAPPPAQIPACAANAPGSTSGHDIEPPGGIGVP
jgi:hypothetical protein